MRTWQIMAVAIVGLGIVPGTNGANLFVDITGAGGAHTNIQAAFTAASTGDTIWVRGGQTFGGAALAWTSAKNGVKLYGGWNGSQTTPYSKNANINANDPANLANANSARDPETVFNGSNSFVVIGNASAVDGVTIRGFHLQNASGNTIEVGFGGSAAYRRNIAICNNVIQTPGGAQGVNMQQAAVPTGGANSNIVFAGNRFLLGTTGNNTAIIANGAYDFPNITIVDNYFKNTAASTDGRAINADGFRYQVQARNVFDSFPRGSFNNDRGYMVMAENKMVNIGSRGMNWQPLYGPELGNVLICNNEITMKDDPSGSAAGSAWAYNVINNGYSINGPLWCRHNKATASNYGGAQLVTFANGSNVVSGVSFELSNNELTVGAWSGSNTINGVGTSAGERGVLRLMDNLPANTTISGNVIQMAGNGALNNTQNAGILGALSNMVSGGNVNITNNSITGVSGTGTGINQAHANWANGVVTLNNNNFVATSVDVSNAATQYINGAGNYFDNGENSVGNVNLTSDAGASNTVAGRNPSYVTFRGDFNLDNAVNDADRLVWSNNFGTAGPAATYFRGDATLDQMVSAADLLVWRRYNGLDINASAPAPAPAVTPGAPVVKYYASTGVLVIDGAASTAWAFEFPGGAANLVVSGHAAGNLGASWKYAAFTNWPATNRFEFVDTTAGGSPAPALKTEVATLQRNLSADAFGPVTYYVGSNTFQTTVYIVPPGTILGVR